LGLGFHWPFGSSTPIGTAAFSPREVSTITSTVMVERSARLFLAKKRSVGCSRPTQTTGDVAVAPGGSRSEREWVASATFQGSLPLTSDAPPPSDHDPAPPSKAPPGARLY
jgi:hypothetical protein